ncbi:MAG: hypothetical protein U0168_11950 [Nannocystaceae bacterium]
MAKAITACATVAAMPGGAPLAELTPQGVALQVFAIGTAVGEQALVRLELDDAHVVGWIPTTALGADVLPQAGITHARADRLGP